MKHLSGKLSISGRQVRHIINLFTIPSSLRKSDSLHQRQRYVYGTTKFSIKPAEIGGVNMWHQDSPYWPILTPKTSQVTAWVALDDVDEGNGCMRMVPGSYHWGNQISFLHAVKDIYSMPERFEEHELDVELCPVPKGYVHYHHSLTWHGSHANNSGEPRRAIAVHYMTNETRYDESGNHVMKRFVTVKDGDKLAGDHFPLVMNAGSPTNP